LIGGLGHTDLSGKVPRPGLLMLRQAVRQAGHEARVANYATSLMPRLFPPAQVERLTRIYERSLKPLVIEGKKNRFYEQPRLAWDLHQLRQISRELAEIEKNTFQEVATEIATEVKAEKFDAVGFSMYLGSSTTGAITIAEVLKKEMPDLPIIFGGPQTTSFTETIFHETSAPTALVLGEGELALVGIMNIIDSLKAGRLGDLSQVPNVAYKNANGKVVITARERLPFQDWVNISQTPYEAADFDGLMKYAFIETSRGCSYLCRFCPQPLLSGRQRYLKPAKVIVDEMISLSRKFRISHFELVGSSTPPGQAEKIAQELLAQGLEDSFSWVLFMRGKDERDRSQGMDATMEKMKRTGASAIFFGVEAADNETLAKMGKNETAEEIQASMLAAQRAGIATIGSFIYPYPGMPANEADLIINFLNEVKPLSAPVQALGLYPGTYDAEHAEEIGCEILYPDKNDQMQYFAGRKPKATLKSQEVLRYLLTYPLILSLPMRFWPPLPYNIDSQPYAQYIKAVNKLQKRIGELGILTGFSHSHHLISQVLKLSPKELFERIFYLSLSGDPQATRALIDRFNSPQA